MIVGTVAGLSEEEGMFGLLLLSFSSFEFGMLLFRLLSLFILFPLAFLFFHFLSLAFFARSVSHSVIMIFCRSNSIVSDSMWVSISIKRCLHQQEVRRTASQKRRTLGFRLYGRPNSCQSKSCQCNVEKLLCDFGIWCSGNSVRDGLSVSKRNINEYPFSKNDITSSRVLQLSHKACQIFFGSTHYC